MTAVQAADNPMPVRFTNVDQILACARSAKSIPAAIQQIKDLLVGIRGFNFSNYVLLGILAAFIILAFYRLLAGFWFVEGDHPRVRLRPHPRRRRRYANYDFDDE